MKDRQQITQVPDLETAMRELEQIVAQIETGQLGIEEGLAKFQRGNYLVQHCRKVLQKAEEQVDSLVSEQPGEQDLPRRKD